MQPQPSLASLAQLACDLIVHNYRLELVGYLGLQDHVPAVGARDGLPGQPDQPGLALACEGERPLCTRSCEAKCASAEQFSGAHTVFATPNRFLVIALPRSPVIRARRSHYLDSIRHWIHQSRFPEVLVVAGADAAMRGDDGLNAITPLRHIVLAGSEPSRLATTLRQISPSYLSSNPSGFQSSSEVAAHSSSSSGTRILPIPYGGLTRQLLTALMPEESKSEGGGATTAATPAVDALIIYTSEGAASESAHFLADALAYLLEPQLADLEDKVERSSLPRGGEGDGLIGGQGSGKGNIKWKEPKSWERGLLGPELARDAGREMYG